jgi:molecular chaperone HscB
MKANPFELFGLPIEFALDLKALERTHRELSKTVHPDKFTDAGASAKAGALSHAVSVNEAYRTLRDPILRATALAHARGMELPENVTLPPAFLMDVMEQRESLQEVRTDAAQLTQLLSDAKASIRAAEHKLEQAFATRASVETLAGLLAQLRYVHRFAEEIDMNLEALDGAA